MTMLCLSDLFRRSATAGLALALLGCTVGPDYEKPATPVPQQWISADRETAQQAAVQQDWWNNFHDPVLTQLIAKAAAGNFDLQLAEARIAEARAVRSGADATLWPTGDVKGTATREANQIAFPGTIPGLKQPFDIFQTGFDASWELDLFGGNRRQIEAATADLEASEASRNDAMVSLLAEVARTYMDIRQFQAQIVLAQATVDSDATTVKIAQQRFETGNAPGFDRTQAEAQLQQARTQLPVYRNDLAQAEYGMDLLLGQQPGATHALVDAVKPIPASDSRLVLAAPASVIANRPDIRVAERKLAMATAQQGVAVAKFFPDISLSGFVGFLNIDAAHLLTAGSESWSGSGTVLWPILSYGSLSANLDAVDARQQEAMITYRKTIAGALLDVEKAVTAYTEQEKYRQEMAKSVAANRHAATIARQRYTEGLTSFIDVLDSERTLYASQNQLTEAEAKTSQDLVAVYKSLGGGWVVAGKYTPRT